MSMFLCVALNTVLESLLVLVWLVRNKIKDNNFKEVVYMNTTKHKFTTRRARHFSKLVHRVGAYLLTSYLSQYSRDELESAKHSILDVVKVLDALIPAAVVATGEPQIANITGKENLR